VGRPHQTQAPAGDPNAGHASSRNSCSRDAGSSAIGSGFGDPATQHTNCNTRGFTNSSQAETDELTFQGGARDLALGSSEASKKQPAF
jgi:hypothetical protein